MGGNGMGKWPTTEHRQLQIDILIVISTSKHTCHEAPPARNPQETMPTGRAFDGYFHRKSNHYCTF